MSKASSISMGTSAAAAAMLLLKFKNTLFVLCSMKCGTVTCTKTKLTCTERVSFPFMALDNFSNNFL